MGVKNQRIILITISAAIPVILIILAVIFTSGSTLTLFPLKKSASDGWWPFSNPETIINSFDANSQKIELEYTFTGYQVFAGVGIFLKQAYPFQDLSKYKNISVKLSASKEKYFGVIIQTFETGITQLQQNGEFSPMRSCETQLKLIEGKNTYSVNLSELQVPRWWINLYAIPGKKLEPNPLKKSIIIQIFFNDMKLRGKMNRVEIYEVALHKSLTWLWVIISIGAILWLLTTGYLLTGRRLQRHEPDEKGRVKLLSYYQKINPKDDRQEEEESITLYISKHYNNPEISLQLLSEETGLSPNRIKEIISQEYKMNFKECIIWLRLQEAKRLLVETDFTVTEIAFELGFSSNSYFGSIFKRQEGLTPKEYRDKHKEVK